MQTTYITVDEAWWGAGMRTRYNSANFGPLQAVAAFAQHFAQGNNQRGIKLLPYNCEASSLPRELTGHLLAWWVKKNVL